MLKRKKYFKDLYRPGFHYSAESHVINDPNGLFYYEGEYHLMHQYNINNHIHWGHAVSRDLVHWMHLPAALAPDPIGQIWSGSAVVDWKNASGLQYGKEKVIAALFTYNEHVDSQQSQGLAYSRDRGRTWIKYEQNPVLTSKGKKDFRDPKVFWFEEKNAWIMVVACGDHVEFYRSANLIEWEFTGEFGSGEGSHQGVWECPDLFRMPIENCPDENKWVLLVSVNSGAPAGGTGMQYFIGEFDGKSFINDGPPEKISWLDYGKDFYAGVTWNDILPDDGRRLMIGWADNWLYRDELPTSLFKGQFSSVRELRLVKKQDEIRIIQRPAEEIRQLRNQRHEITPCDIFPDSTLELPVEGNQFEIICELAFKGSHAVMELMIGDSGRDLIKIVYDRREEKIIFDRTNCNQYHIEHFRGRFKAPFKLEDEILKLHILVDSSQIELFAGDGSVVMTNLFFGGDPRLRVRLAAGNSPLRLVSGRCYNLSSVWPDKKSESDLFENVFDGKWMNTVQGFEGCCAADGLVATTEKSHEFRVQSRLKITSYQSGKSAGLAFGINEMGIGYRVVFDAEKKEMILFYDKIQIGKAAVIINTERTYLICVEMKGGNLKVYIDGVELFKEKLNEYTGGALGLCVSETNALFNNIEITNS